MDMFQDQAQAKGLALRSELDEDMPECLLGDESRIRQVLFHLVGNAVKFSKQGEVSAQLSFLPMRGGAGRLKLLALISDQGVGLASEFLGRAYDPFVQGDSPYTKRFSGLGLGLAIVRRFVILMNGSICLTSEPGLGTDVCLDMEASVAEAFDARSAAPDESSRAVGCKVLLVEDDAINQAVLGKMLSRLGCEVQWAGTGQAALERMEQGGVDLVVMDIQTSAMDGLEAAAHIRSSTSGAFDPNTPILALTALAGSDNAEASQAAGLAGRLAKPVKLDELTQAVERILADRAGRKG